MVQVKIVKIAVKARFVYRVFSGYHFDTKNCEAVTVKCGTIEGLRTN